MSEPLQLATCTYQEFQEPMGVPVRTTAGHPRFSLGYQLAGHARLVTPDRDTLKLPQDAFTFTYRRKLTFAGVDAIRAELALLAGDAGRVVLLCFDRLDRPGVWCHRSLFAQWFYEQTGEEVPELGAVPRPAPYQPPSLF